MSAGREPQSASWLGKLLEPGMVWVVLMGGVALVTWGSTLNSRMGSLEISFAENQRTVNGRLDNLDRELRDTSKAVTALGPELRAIRELMDAGQKRDQEVQQRLVESLRLMDQRWTASLAAVVAGQKR